MNSQLHNKPLTHKEMQELLPDYVLDRLDAGQAARFEASMPLYPDIIQEVAEGRQVFERLESMNIDKLLASKTRNMSVLVNDRLRAGSRQPRLSWMLRYAVPSFGIVVLAALMIWGSDIFMQNQPAGTAQSQGTAPVVAGIAQADDYHILTKSDALVLFDTTTTIDELNSISAGLLNTSMPDVASLDAKDDDQVDTIVSQYMNNNMDLAKSAQSYARIYSQVTAPEMLDQLNQLSEDDIQEILEELENANINS